MLGPCRNGLSYPSIFSANNEHRTEISATNFYLILLFGSIWKKILHEISSPLFSLLQGYTTYYLHGDMEIRSASYFWILEQCFSNTVKDSVKGKNSSNLSSVVKVRLTLGRFKDEGYTQSKYISEVLVCLF